MEQQLRGDNSTYFEDEKEAKQIASKRSQLMREQSVRTQRHITLMKLVVVLL
jgi:translation initiation factor IF-2